MVMVFEAWQNWSQIIKIALMIVAMFGGVIALWLLNEIRKNTEKN